LLPLEAKRPTEPENRWFILIPIKPLLAWMGDYPRKHERGKM
jgi:hypothetical protein